MTARRTPGNDEGQTPVPQVTPMLPVAVIGAGAAGLMAAIHAAGTGCRVVLLERTRDGGRKILISGGGRCNVLPSQLDPARFVSESPPHLVRRVLAGWPLARQRAFFEEVLGLPLALEAESGKLFPVSNRARDVRDRLVAGARDAGAELRFGTAVTGVERSAAGWGVMFEDQAPLEAGAVIVATGGLSVPATGSDGMGLSIARRLGHTIRETYPALTPLVADPPVHAHLSGLSLEVRIEARVGGKRFRSEGGFLFTHRGYSGPSVLDLSHLAVRSRLTGGERQVLRVAWSRESAEVWNARLQRRSPRTVQSTLREVIPARLVEQLLGESQVRAGCQLAQLSRDDRRRIVELLSAYPLPWTGDEGYRKAEVTGGGVALEEIDPVTLQSRLCPGIHFCGEVLDAFGPIGGHNFAWAWATGRAAGLGVSVSAR
ncbi:MAG: aminoacetone oxidase family FAD-binding enzyme [Gemmatimonadota bacterium]|nr:aminoacetone oxidase family FAD-binding enzyme [Gemmatimonadota bacterium]